MKRSDIDLLPEYFDRYINQVADTDLLQAFDESLTQLANLDRNLLAKLDGKTYAAGKWTAKGHLQHVADFERILNYRTLLFARREGSVPQSIDQDKIAANMQAEGKTIDALLDELKAVRLATRAMFANFDDKTLQTKGINWKYEVSVLAMGFTMIGHQIHHLKILEEKYYPLA